MPGVTHARLAVKQGISHDHHTDAEREYAYDRQSHFGKLDVALNAASANKWTVVDMKKDWRRIFAFDS